MIKVMCRYGERVSRKGKGGLEEVPFKQSWMIKRSIMHIYGSRGVPGRTSARS